MIKNIFDLNSRLLSIKKVSACGFIHEYDAPQIAELSKPGQFVEIKISPLSSPLLRRPFSILKTDKEKGSIFVLFKVFGDTTALLSEKQVGDSVPILGPLGNWFNPGNNKTLFMVGGGVGIPPLFNLINSLENDKYNVNMYLGASSKEELWLRDDIEKTSATVSFVTDDGSFGEKGLVTLPLKRDLENCEYPDSSLIISCGPMPMLSAVKKLGEIYGIKTQLSVETVMACGIGICMGCVVPNTNDGYSLVCKDGPIFPGEDIKI